MGLNPRAPERSGRPYVPKFDNMHPCRNAQCLSAADL